MTSREKFEQLKIKKQEIITSMLRRKPEAERIQKQINTLESCLDDLKKELRDLSEELNGVYDEFLELEYNGLMKQN